MVNLSIQFNGIAVSAETRVYIEDCFQAIFSLSPSESSVSFNFEKKGEEFFGDVKIVAQIKNFEISCEANSLEDVMKMLNLEVRQHLKKWKKGRFEVA